MLTAYRITHHLLPQSPLRLQQRNGLEPPLDATAQVLSGCPECPRAPDVKRQGNCPRPARLLLSPTRRENMPDGNSSVYPLPVTARSLARPSVTRELGHVLGNEQIPFFRPKIHMVSRASISVRPSPNHSLKDLDTGFSSSWPQANLRYPAHAWRKASITAL